jgi:ubiquinone/menaquinone biosynthesis C-methylase UbiE
MYECEVDVVEGLERFAIVEVESLGGLVVDLRETARPGALRFGYAGPPDDLLDLRSVVAVYLVGAFPIPRPRALLGHQHFQALTGLIAQVRDLWTPRSFRTLRLSAAGEDSSTLVRLKQELALHTGLAPSDEGDLLVRLRRAEQEGWEVLVRLSPRPLATRAWRVRNLPGALNATVAYAMARLTGPRPDDTLLNLACGSGTLLIERLTLGPADLAIGCDTDQSALAAARENLAAAGLDRAVRLEHWDATWLPLPDRSIRVVLADLPFGQLVGSHRANEALYPSLLAEATRVAAPGARMVLITHEVRLLERAAAPLMASWRLDELIRVRVGGMAPRIFRFTRTAP